MDIDFLALLAHRASAAPVGSAAPQGATVEPVLELLAVLGFPCLDCKAVLLLDLVAVPFWDDVEAAEGYDGEVGREVMDVAALQSFLVLIVRPLVSTTRAIRFRLPYPDTRKNRQNQFLSKTLNKVES